MKRRTSSFDLKKNYTLNLELGVIASLLLCITAFKIQLPDATSTVPQLGKLDNIPIVLPPITKTKITPPAPLLPQLPVSVPDDTPIETAPLNFGNFDDFNPAPLPEHVEDEEEGIPEAVEFMPEMRGGVQALYNEINYPEGAKRSRIEGTVIVQFVVNEHGEVVDPVIVRGIGGGCDEEVLRALKLQKFTPGVQNGQLVKVKMKQGVRFMLR